MQPISASRLEEVLGFGKYLMCAFHGQGQYRISCQCLVFPSIPSSTLVNDPTNNDPRQQGHGLYTATPKGLETAPLDLKDALCCLEYFLERITLTTLRYQSHLHASSCKSKSVSLSSISGQLTLIPMSSLTVLPGMAPP